MGLDIVVTDFSFRRNALAYDVPVVDQCQGWWFFGDDAFESQRNLMEGQPNAILVGAPLAFPHYVRTDGRVSYYQTAIPDPEAGTFVCVARSADTGDASANRPTFLGTSDGSATGANLYQGDVTMLSGNSYLDVGGVPTSNGANLATTVNPMTDFRLYIFDFGLATQAIYNMTGGGSFSESQPANDGRLISGSPVFIGGGPNAGNHGKADMAMAAIYSKQLSSAERSAIYDRLKAYYGRRGIVI